MRFIEWKKKENINYKHWNMKRLIILLFALLPVTMIAQESKIAYVNYEEVMTAMPEFNEMRTKLEALEGQLRNTYTSLHEEYERKASDYIAQQDSLPDNIKQMRMADISQLQERIENFAASMQGTMQEEQGKMFTPISDKLNKAIQDVGKDKGYLYILDSRVMFYQAAEATNATSFVKQKLGL